MSVTGKTNKYKELRTTGRGLYLINEWGPCFACLSFLDHILASSNKRLVLSAECIREVFQH